MNLEYRNNLKRYMKKKKKMTPWNFYIPENKIKNGGKYIEISGILPVIQWIE